MFALEDIDFGRRLAVEKELGAKEGAPSQNVVGGRGPAAHHPVGLAPVAGACALQAAGHAGRGGPLQPASGPLALARLVAAQQLARTGEGPRWTMGEVGAAAAAAGGR
jgi:hypothetical protein